MHIVTFYSFKGGVGRTMALVNIAAVIAQRGLKVLIVDFDLEAPGISTYPAFTNLNEARGIVEYVSNYMEQAASPKVSEFIYECKLSDSTVWVMPAGHRNDEYSFRLNSIDWQSLYAIHSGYLMFEDLKQQWENENFDYVLIDSRTGHTDVGGICTRHLPHAVVLMFFPNDQNLVGLETVVNEIRQEPKGARQEDIILHFCASNVPDLDDEDQILEGKLLQARKQLSYESDPILIRHYNSLALLEQRIFVIDRPSSRLSDEYRTLANAIVSKNLEDREGALGTLRRYREELRTKMRDEDVSSLLGRTLGKIRDLHPNDGEIAWTMAGLYSQIGDFESEADRLTVAIENNVFSSVARRRRAAIARLEGRHEDALADLQTILSDRTTTGLEFVAAVELLRQVDSNWISIVSRSPILLMIEPETKIRLAEILMSDRGGNELVISLLSKALTSIASHNPVFANMHTRMILALISSGQYEAAMTAIGSDRSKVLHLEDLPDVFNYAMAEWGQKGAPPADLMQVAIKLIENDDYRDPNRYQCLALAQYVCGLTVAAKESLKRAAMAPTGGRRVFSCWRYLEVTRPQMRTDLALMERVIDGDAIAPTVFTDALPRIEGGRLL